MSATGYHANLHARPDYMVYNVCWNLALKIHGKVDVACIEHWHCDHAHIDLFNLKCR